ncbi:MAG: multidrug effflux MFS transporter [Paracoccaceae bacterium]|nr:multidrug effflux MFS transporter [Paracoccaceae bacterium]
MSAEPSAASPISRTELVALLAMMSATVAFSIDAMLPALPNIASDLALADSNDAQLVIAAFVIGMGFGTLFSGPLSDAVGRHRIVVAGSILYVVGALLGAIAPTLETLLAARALQGLGASGPRVAAVAISRDLFSGRQMARIVSFIMTVFTLVPVLAPTIGAGIAWVFGWRAIFVSFAVFSIISTTWLLVRQPETLPSEKRRPFRPRELSAGMREVFSNGQVMLAIAVQTIVFTILFICLLSSQPVMDQAFGRGASFPFWFGVVAAISATASMLNAAIVIRIGMRRVVLTTLAGQTVISGGYLALQWSGALAPGIDFALFIAWMTTCFGMAGLCIGNLNALALQPMGHIAGMAASITAATATVFSMLLAAPVGQAFDGTPVPMTVGILAATIVGLLLMLRTREPEEF